MIEPFSCSVCQSLSVLQPGQAADAWYFLTSNPSEIYCGLRCLAVKQCGGGVVDYLERLHLEDVESVAEIQAERYALSYKPCGNTPPGSELSPIEWHLVQGAA